MPYRKPGRIDSPADKNLDQVLSELPMINRTQAKISLKIATVRDECSKLYAAAFERFVPGARILKDILRNMGGSMAYSRPVSRREMVESELHEKHNPPNLK
jgi:hypothetical protein